jgi:hypothetical protein
MIISLHALALEPLHSQATHERLCGDQMVVQGDVWMSW